jgi:hypothetical protein
VLSVIVTCPGAGDFDVINFSNSSAPTYLGACRWANFGRSKEEYLFVQKPMAVTQPGNADISREAQLRFARRPTTWTHISQSLRARVALPATWKEL